MLSALGVLILAMYTPTVYKLFQIRWWREEYSHAPLIFLIFFWLLWQERKVIQEPLDKNVHAPALIVLLLGVFLYWLGVKQRAIVLETASIPFVIMGAYYFLLGKIALRWLFPAVYLVFIIPPPMFLVDMITFPLKKVVSIWSVWILDLMKYPIIRRGVLLSIGDYKLLVADACSGMRSIISLLALVSLYVYLQNAAISRRLLVLVSIIPIAVMANAIRVTSLALITYHYGEAAGQSFYHDFSGFVVFAFALGSVVLVDKLAQVFLEPRKVKNA